ncbi:MAG: hypothetical protein N3D20_02310, partial [Candidatus Pacearchaeota archaeon]|nr:hypothetical protein [Candidatus Pacearchaeota archaeon]
KSNPSQALDVVGAIYSTGGISTAGNLNAASWATSSMATTGYAKMANVYLQWGKSLSTTDDNQVFYFPTSFPNNCLVVVPSIDLGSGYVAPFCTSSYFVINRNNNVDGDEYFNWIAIGY